MKTLSLLFACFVGMLSLACNKSDGSETITPQKGYVSGTVANTKGQPIENAFVFISSTGPYSSGVSVHTDAQGHYRIKMNYGAYRIYATFEKAYAGKTFEIQLKPDNSDSFSVNDSPYLES